MRAAAACIPLLLLVMCLAPVPAQAGDAEDAIAIAKAELGAPYVWGAYDQPPGFDCSGFISHVYRRLGFDLPRVSRNQAILGMLVKAPKDLQPADLVFFTKHGRGHQITHVGLYIGDGLFIHAATSQRKVVIDDLNAPHYKKRYHHGRRLLGVTGRDAVARRPTPPPTPEAAPAPVPEPSDLDPVLHAPRPGEGSMTTKRTGRVLDEVFINGLKVRDRFLVEQLKGVDTGDPDQFEHAGEGLPDYMKTYLEPADSPSAAPVPQEEP